MVRDVCKVVSCSKEADKETSLHVVPKDETVSQKWHCFLQIANQDFPGWKPIRRMHICSQHFTSESISSGALSRRNLVTGAYPTVLNGRDLRQMILQRLQPPKSHSDLSFVKIDKSFANSVVDCGTLPFNSIIHFSEDESCGSHDQSKDKIISDLQAKIAALQDEVQSLKYELKLFKQRQKRGEDSKKRKSETVQELQQEVKKFKHKYKSYVSVSTQSEPVLSTSIMETLFSEIMSRRKGQPYSDIMREFAFTVHYFSPRAYNYLRKVFEDKIPHAVTFPTWTRSVVTSPGFLQASLHHIKLTNSNSSYPVYYALSFDEIAIRHQFLFDGNKIIGTVNYAGISKLESEGIATSALFCLATQVNGSSAIPICYILTKGLKTDVMVDFVTKCLNAIHDCGGRVISVSCDGLRSNFTALQKLGANLDVESESFQSYILHQVSKEKVYIIPDACHMLKLVRNTLKERGVMYNGEGKAIRWSHVKKLVDAQNEAGVRAANKLTQRHVEFEQQKMKVKICVQVFSKSTACAMDLCRKIQMDGLEDSEATAEFFRIMDQLFDILNSKPKGIGSKAPLRNANKHHWLPFLQSAKTYLLSLQCRTKTGVLLPVYKTTRATCIKGLITAISSVISIMEEIEQNKIELLYYPVYKSMQDLLELFFGKVRSRLGKNNNPNVKQLEHAVKGLLCFSINACKTGNCLPQDDTGNNISPLSLAGLINAESDTSNEESYTPQKSQDYSLKLIPDFSQSHKLSLFIENVIVYISGFTGRKLKDILKCNTCEAALLPQYPHEMRLRSDFILLNEKDEGGLFCPSQNLINVCKLTERVIRTQQLEGITKIDLKKIQSYVVKESLECSYFAEVTHDIDDHSWMNLKNGLLTHRYKLILEICNCYASVRLHYAAKVSSLEARPVTKRNFLTKIIQFSGN